jgi:hypothetical protein
MEEVPENVKESSHSAHANGINELSDIKIYIYIYIYGRIFCCSYV